MYRFALSTFLTSLVCISFGQAYYPVPDWLYTRDASSIRFQGSDDLTYVEGIGWLNPTMNLPLIETDAQIFAQADFFSRLGLETPLLKEVRVSTGQDDRVVFELVPDSNIELGSLSYAGEITGSLSLELPYFLPPQNLHLPNFLDLSISPSGNKIIIESDANQYKVFTLTNPDRIVIDLFRSTESTPFSYPLPELSSLGPGLTYQRIVFPTAEKTSVVHIVEILPGYGQFKVVGRVQGGAKLSQLASGSQLAINAGYFDPSTFNSIGFLKIDYGTLSLPSRNRAVVAFNQGSASMDRANSLLELFSRGQLVYSQDLEDSSRLSLHKLANTWVGQPDTGVICVQNGIIIENKIGPRQVPGDGFCLVYAPALRELALLNPGDPLTFQVRIQPGYFETLPYAVEAGPLLFKNGAQLYQPELEHFSLGTRILEAVTQQSVIATRASGSTLFIVAETMTAQDLLPLMHYLQVKDAMRLDSGSSSALWANQMILNKTRERTITSAIVFITSLESSEQR